MVYGRDIIELVDGFRNKLIAGGGRSCEELYNLVIGDDEQTHIPYWGNPYLNRLVQWLSCVNGQWRVLAGKIIELNGAL